VTLRRATGAGSAVSRPVAAGLAPLLVTRSVAGALLQSRGAGTEGA
jgi:hypothetical protein